MVFLLHNPEVRRQLGAEGKRIVADNFLTPRLIRDELRLIKSLLDKKPS